MIITKQKEFADILAGIREDRVFLVGCGECATLCKTGGNDELVRMKAALEAQGKTVTGSAVPDAPCVAAQVKLMCVKHAGPLSVADGVLVLACGLGVQSVRETLQRQKKTVHVHGGCDTLFMGAVVAHGVFVERCSACGECLLEQTAGICPVTRCPKGLLNGPCGGQHKGTCDVDRTQECVWVLIYEELKKRGDLHLLKKIRKAKDHSKMLKPRHVTLVR